MRYILVQNGVVINAVLWDGETEVNFGEGVTAVKDIAGQYNIGDSYP